MGSSRTSSRPSLPITKAAILGGAVIFLVYFIHRKAEPYFRVNNTPPSLQHPLARDVQSQFRSVFDKFKTSEPVCDGDPAGNNVDLESHHVCLRPQCVAVVIVRNGGLQFVDTLLDKSTCSVHTFLEGKKDHHLYSVGSMSKRLRVYTTSGRESVRNTLFKTELTGNGGGRQGGVDLLHMELSEDELSSFLEAIGNGQGAHIFQFLLRVKTRFSQNSPTAPLQAPEWTKELGKAGLLLREVNVVIFPEHLEVMLTLKNLRFNKDAKSGTSITPQVLDPYKDEGQQKRAMWKSLTSRANCATDKLERVGGRGDGGKWLCDLESVPHTSCIVYSFGVKGDSRFEAEILKRRNCEIFAFDPEDTKIGHPLEPNTPRVTFTKMAVGKKNSNDTITIKGIMEKYGHSWVDIIKMDIEQSEYDTLDKLLADFPDQKSLPVGQMTVEFHVWDWTGTEFGSRVVPLFNRLLERGVAVFHSEKNPVYPDLCWEYSFLNVKSAANKTSLSMASHE